MLRKINKKGQIEWFQLFIIILGLLAVIVIAVGTFKGWDYIFGKQSALPGDLTIAIGGCKGAADTSLGSSYFCDFRTADLGSGKQLYSCPRVYVEARKYLNDSAIGFLPTAFPCAGDAEKEQCYSKSKLSGYKDSIMINGKSCKELLSLVKCVGFPYNGRELCIAPKNCTAGNEIKGPVDANATAVCCNIACV